MKKKVLSLLLAGVLTIGMLAGCGAKKEETTKEDSKKTEKSADKSEASSDETDTIRVATGGKYALFSQTNDQGELEGIEIDIWTEIGKRLNREIEWVVEPFSAQFGDLDNGRVDTVAQQVSVTDERKEKYNFSTVYFYSPLMITVSDKNTDINSVEDLYGKTVAAPNGSAEIALLKNMDPNGKINISIYADGASAYKDTDMQRADACVLSAITLKQTNENNDTNLKQVGDPIFVEEDAYPFAKTERGDVVRKQVNKVLQEMIDDGTIAEISKKWSGVDPFEVAGK